MAIHHIYIISIVKLRNDEAVITRWQHPARKLLNYQVFQSFRSPFANCTTVKVFLLKTKLVKCSPENTEVAPYQKAAFLKFRHTKRYQFRMNIRHMPAGKVIKDEIQALVLEIAYNCQRIAFNECCPAGKAA